ncbi:hypothetical protein [Solibacillus cecembensis]|uniref:hypothetical protein n=1 Tax=Solibacillus cecembensis TaxID=459347 RepID=UPI003A9F7C3F
MKKRIRLFLICSVVSLVFFFIYNKSTVTNQEALPELNDYTIQRASVLNPRTTIVQLNNEEIKHLLEILENETYKKKWIPNIQKFNRDIAIAFDFSNTDIKISISLDFARNIIGIQQDRGKMKQFILKKDSELFSYMTNYL